MAETGPYYLVLLLAAIPALTTSKGKPGLGWYYFLLFLLLFVGLRFQVGSDWKGYLQIADEMANLKFSELFEYPEFLYYFVVWSSVDLGLGIYGANVVTTLIFLLGLLKFCKMQHNRWLALMSSLPFLVIVIGMSANRQAAAIGVTLYLLAVWRSSSLIKKILLISIGTLFHTSAVIFLLMFVIDGKISVVRKVLISASLLAVAMYLLADAGTSARYEKSYIEGRDIFQAAGALQQIFINAFPAFFIISFRRRLKKIIPEFSVIFSMSLLALILIPIGIVFSVAAARLSFYLFPVSIACLSALPELFGEKRSESLARYLIILYGFASLALWLNFANHAYNHKPYSNLLFG